MDEYKIPMLYPVVSADDLSQRKPSKWVVRTGWTSSQPNQPFGEYVAKTLGYKRVVTIANDYAFGWEQVAGFQRTYEENGGQVVQKLWPPLGTTDLAPFLSQIRKDADAVFALMVAATALRFPRQYQDAGLKAKLPRHRRRDHLRRVRPPLAGGRGHRRHHAAHLQRGARHADQPALREGLPREVRQVPSYYSETMYTCARWIAEAAKAAGGDVEDREKFLAALRKVEIPDAPRGPLKLDQWGGRHPEHLRAQGREEGRRALEHRDPHVPRRSPSSGSTTPRSS